MHSMFKGTSKDSHNDPLACTLEIYYEEAIKYISVAPFIAVMLWLTKTRGVSS